MITVNDYSGTLNDFWNFKSSNSSSRKQYALVIEDSHMDFLWLERTIRSRNKNIILVHVESVDEAKVTLQNDQSFDLIICDQFLPGTDTGIAFWRYCQQKFPDIPFLMTSASDLSSFFETIDKDLAPPFLHKPFTPWEAWKQIEPFVDEGPAPQVDLDPISDENKRKISAVLATCLMAIIFLLVYGCHFNEM